MSPNIAIILPACDEAACLPRVLSELLPEARRLGCAVAVGLNDCHDASASVLTDFNDVIVGYSMERGYGQGCVAAMDAVEAAGHQPQAYIFMSADGAHDPAELSRLIDGWRAGADLVIGQRTLVPANWAAMGLTRTLCNALLGLWAGVLSGGCYADLGPYRLVSRRLLTAWSSLPRELRWGWTIEPQVLAPRLGLKVRCLPVQERARLAGEQKVTGVSLRHSLRIGHAIFRAAWAMHRATRAARVMEPSLIEPA